MKFHRHIFLLLSLSSAPAFAAYSISSIGTLDDGFAVSAIGINNKGQIIGYGPPSQYGYSPFLYENGKTQSLGVAIGAIGGTSSSVYDINDKGQIVGSSSFQGARRAFVYANGVAQNLGVLNGYAFSEAYGINERGDIVGYNMQPASDYLTKAFIYKNGTMQGLSSDGLEPYSMAYSINDSEQIAGTTGTAIYRPLIYANGSSFIQQSGSGIAFRINESGQAVGYIDASNATYYGYRAFLYSNGALTNLGSLSDRIYEESYAYGINDLGQIVGQSTTRNGERAFVYMNGSMQDLSSLVTNADGWILSEARDINNSGQIIGNGTFNGQARAFLLTPLSPVPEPSTYMLMMMGLGIAALKIKHKSSRNEFQKE